MTHSVTPPINEPNNSPQHSSSTFTISSDNGLRRPTTTNCGSRIGPSHVSCQHISNRQSPTSGGSRSPALSHENSDVENSLRNDSIEDSVVGTVEDSMSSSREKFGSARGYSRFTKLPRPLKSFQYGKLLDKFRNHPHFGSETVIEAPPIENILKLWKWEVLNCVLAVGMLGSMYGILLRYDGQRIPDWGTAINLSTLIALIATVFRAMLCFVVAEIIGQAKWKYFASDRRPSEDPPSRRLIETSRFNDASQGLIGAFKLLPTIVRDPTTLLAVTVMIVSMGTGSFVQQAIQTQPCQFPMDEVRASLPISRNITAGKDGGSISGASTFGPLDGPNVLAALSSALAPDSEEIGLPISKGCPTGNCTFQNLINGVYSTLGVCSRCIDTSSLITSSEKPWYKGGQKSHPTIVSLTNYTLPNGMKVQGVFSNTTSNDSHHMELLISASPEMGLDWAGDLASPEMMALSQWAFANVTILTSSWLPKSSWYTDYVAVTCTLYPCLRSYNASVSSGELNEVLVSTAPAVPNVAAMFDPNITAEAIQNLLYEDPKYYTDIWMYTNRLIYPAYPSQAVQSPCLANNTVWTKENKSSTFEMQRLLLLHADPDPSGARRFTVENTTAPAECLYGLDGVATGEFMQAMQDQLFNGSCFADLNFSSLENTTQVYCGKEYWLARFYSDNGTTVDRIIKQFQDFTDRLSNKLRMGLLNDPEAVSGQVLQATVCSRMNYSWLTFPAVLVAATSGLLAWTMFRSSRRRVREMVWKTSILPFLFYGDRFVVQNGEDVSGYSTESPRRDEAEPLLDLDQMETEARQRVVRFNVYE